MIDTIALMSPTLSMNTMSLYNLTRVQKIKIIIV